MIGPECYEPIFFRKQHLVRPVRKSQYMQQSLHLLPRHKNSIRPLERRELERSLGDQDRNRWKWNHWISAKLSMQHRSRLGELRDYTRLINIVEYIRSKEERSDKQ